MAKIGIENIEKVMLHVLPMERRFDSARNLWFDSAGDLLVHPVVALKYQEKKYDEKPKTRAEADARGEKSFNGLMSSFPYIRVYPDDGKNIVVADIAPTRYLVGQAMRDIVGSGQYSDEEMKNLSPNMANVSVVVPVNIAGRYFLISQIKGKALGSGQVHAAMVAGNIDAKYLQATDPFSAALREECSEEVGLDLSSLDLTSVVYMVDERETGQVNFASVARQADFINVFTAYEQSTKEKLSQHEALEVMALCELPVAGLALVPLKDGSMGFPNIRIYQPTPTGLVVTVEERGVRPYTQATLDYLAKPENLKFLLEKAGF